MVAPGLLAVSTPVIFAIILPSLNIVSESDGMQMLAGVLAGVTVCGVLMAIFMSNAGGAWDNAKKHIEGGAHGGKGSDAHKAAVVGDTVGDPFKDTAGPSLNILIKLMSVVSSSWNLRSSFIEGSTPEKRCTTYTPETTWFASHQID